MKSLTRRKFLAAGLGLGGAAAFGLAGQPLRAYERVARLAAPLVVDGGVLGLCSCSHAADLSAFRTASARGIGRAGRSPAVIYTGFAGPDHPQLPQLAESGYLKSVFFQL